MSNSRLYYDPNISIEELAKLNKMSISYDKDRRTLKIVSPYPDKILLQGTIRDAQNFFTINSMSSKKENKCVYCFYSNTFRTSVENYYVATDKGFGELSFEALEANTRDLFSHEEISEMKKIFKKSFNSGVTDYCSIENEFSKFLKPKKTIKSPRISNPSPKRGKHI